MSTVIGILFTSAGYDRAAQGVVGEARRLADALGVPLRMVCVGGDAEMARALASVADGVTMLSLPGAAPTDGYQPEPCLAALAEYCRAQAPLAVLLGNDTWSQELAPRLAHRLGGSAVGDAVAIELSGGRLRARRSVYGGKAMATIELRRSPAVVWIRARAFDPPPQRPATASAQTAEVLEIVLPDELPTRIVERCSESTGEARLEDARVIVSGGRGLGGPEPFTELQELATLLGGMTAASRAACDSGWCPPSWQVGQTGKKVAPGLYLAVAIRGASQHLAGISEAKTIAAVNSDPDALIFKHCRFGIVEDYRKVLPLLRERLAAMREKGD